MGMVGTEPKARSDAPRDLNLSYFDRQNRTATGAQTRTRQTATTFFLSFAEPMDISPATVAATAKPRYVKTQKQVVPAQSSGVPVSKIIRVAHTRLSSVNRTHKPSAT